MLINVKLYINILKYEQKSINIGIAAILVLKLRIE